MRALWSKGLEQAYQEDGLFICRVSVLKWCILGSMLKALRYLSPGQWPHFQLVNHCSPKNTRVNVSGLQSIKVGVCLGFPLISNPLHFKQRGHFPCWLPNVDPLIYVFVCACLSVCVPQARRCPCKSEEGLQIPQSWNHRKLWVDSYGCWELNVGPL